MSSFFLRISVCFFVVALLSAFSAYDIYCIRGYSAWHISVPVLVFTAFSVYGAMTFAMHKGWIK